jgi:hypothetical protein
VHRVGRRCVVQVSRVWPGRAPGARLPTGSTKGSSDENCLQPAEARGR